MSRTSVRTGFVRLINSVLPYQSVFIMSVKNLCILGATGDLGKPLVRLALAAGHRLRCVVRNVNNSPFPPHENLSVVQGNVFDAEDLQNHFRGQDAVISALGFPKKEAKVTEFTDSIQAIIKAMQATNVTRLVTISAWFTDPVTRVGHPMFENVWSKLPGLPNTLNNEGEMEQILSQTPDIQFTSVRVSGLTWEAATGQDFYTEENYWVSNVPGGGGLIPREDVARFMLDTIDDPQWLRKAVAIAIATPEDEAANRMQEHFGRYLIGDVTTH